MTAARRSPPSRVTSRDEDEAQAPEASAGQGNGDVDLAADLAEAANA